VRLRRYLKYLTRTVRSVFRQDPIEILAYYGYGNRTRANVHGRVLEVRNVSKSGDRDSTLRNLLNTYRRAEADPIPFATIQVECSNTTVTMTADDEGFFTGWMNFNEPLNGDDEWNEYKVSLVAPVRPDSKGECTGIMLVPARTARLGVISDIDDTVIQSRVSNFLQAARTVMLGNARTRLPFPGVAAFYRALRDGASGDEKNPIYYVSSSPWNIFDVISEFMDLQKIPRGPLLLRDWDIGWGLLSSSRHLQHKIGPIRDIMGLHPELQFILIGDSSQHDPEIYRQVVAEFPNRVKAIYIRDVTASPERSTSVKKLADEVLASGSMLVLAEHTLDAARHAAEHGWIKTESLSEVGEEKRADEGRDDTKAPAPAGGEPGPGKPTVVVESSRS